MKTTRRHLPAALAGAAAALFLVLASGFRAATPEEGRGRYQVEMSQDGSVVVLLDSTNGSVWMRTESGRALSRSAFQALGGPEGGK